MTTTDSSYQRSYQSIKRESIFTSFVVRGWSAWWSSYAHTVEPHYNEVLGTMKITLLYQVSHIRVKKQRNIKSWDQQNYLVIRGFCYIRPLYNEVPLYFRNGKGACVVVLLRIKRKLMNTDCRLLKSCAAMTARWGLDHRMGIMGYQLPCCVIYSIVGWF